MILRKVLPVGMIMGAAILPIATTSVSADTVTDNLNNSKKLQSYFEDNYATISAAVPSPSAMAAAQSEMASDTQTLNTIPRNRLTSYTSTIKLSKTWLNAYQQYVNATNLAQQNNALNLLSTIAQVETNNNVFSGKGLDTKTLYDPSNLPQNELIKINNYFAGLVNSIHTQLSDNQTTYANKNAMSFATDVANGYQNANYLATIDHNVPLINSAAANHGLRTNSLMNMYENVTEAFVTSQSHKQFTEQELFEMIYKASLNLTINDAYSNFNHLKGLLADQSLGLDFSTVTDSNNWYYTQMQVVGVTDDSEMRHRNQFEAMYGISSSQTLKPNSAQASAQSAYNSASAAVTSTAMLYNAAMMDYNYDVAVAARSLSSANAAVSSAQADYDLVHPSSASSQSSQTSSASSQASSASSQSSQASSASSQASSASSQSSQTSSASSQSSQTSSASSQASSTSSQSSQTSSASSQASSASSQSSQTSSDSSQASSASSQSSQTSSDSSQASSASSQSSQTSSASSQASSASSQSSQASSASSQASSASSQSSQASSASSQASSASSQSSQTSSASSQASSQTSSASSQASSQTSSASSQSSQASSTSSQASSTSAHGDDSYASLMSSIASAESSMAAAKSSAVASMMASQSAYQSSVASAQASIVASLASSTASYQSSVASSIASLSASIASSIASSQAAQQNSSAASNSSGTNTFDHPIIAHLYIEAHLYIVND